MNSTKKQTTRFKKVSLFDFSVMLEELEFNALIEFACTMKNEGKDEVDYSGYWGITRKNLFDTDMYIASPYGGNFPVVHEKNSTTTVEEFLEQILKDDYDNGYVYIDTLAPVWDSQEQYYDWLKGREDIFIVSINNYLKNENEPTLTSGCDDIFFSLTASLNHIEEYIESCETKSNEETFTEFEVRFFNPPVEDRKELYPDSRSIFDLSDFTEIEPLISRKI